MILLPRRQYKKILDHALKALPNEACGILGGQIKGTVKTVKEVYLLTNTDHSPVHFSMDPKEQFAAVKNMRKNDWLLIGNFHSHPETPARPSEEDRKIAYDPEISYLILSFLDPHQPVLKSFQIGKNTILEEKIMIEEE